MQWSGSENGVTPRRVANRGTRLVQKGAAGLSGLTQAGTHLGSSVPGGRAAVTSHTWSTALAPQGLSEEAWLPAIGSLSQDRRLLPTLPSEEVPGAKAGLPRAPTLTSYTEMTA